MKHRHTVFCNWDHHIYCWTFAEDFRHQTLASTASLLIWFDMFITSSLAVNTQDMEGKVYRTKQFCRANLRNDQLWATSAYKTYCIAYHQLFGWVVHEALNHHRIAESARLRMVDQAQEVHGFVEGQTGRAVSTTSNGKEAVHLASHEFSSLGNGVIDAELYHKSPSAVQWYSAPFRGQKHQIKRTCGFPWTSQAFTKPSTLGILWRPLQIRVSDVAEHSLVEWWGLGHHHEPSSSCHLLWSYDWQELCQHLPTLEVLHYPIKFQGIMVIKIEKLKNSMGVAGTLSHSKTVKRTRAADVPYSSAVIDTPHREVKLTTTRHGQKPGRYIGFCLITILSTFVVAKSVLKQHVAVEYRWRPLWGLKPTGKYVTGISPE